MARPTTNNQPLSKFWGCRITQEMFELSQKRIKQYGFKSQSEYILFLLKQDFERDEEHIELKLKEIEMERKRLKEIAKQNQNELNTHKTHLDALLNDQEFNGYITLLKRYFDGTNPIETIYEIEPYHRDKLKQFKITMDELVELGTRYYMNL